MWTSRRSDASGSTTTTGSRRVAAGERIVFFGTPAAAVPPLRAIVDAGFEVALIVTQPDRRRGRGGATVPSPVKQAGEELGIPVVTPARAREALEAIRATGATRGVVVAFGQLLPPEVIDSFPAGMVNLHYSRLPRWRGAAPVERAILAGDAETAVAVMGVDVTLDTGPVYAEAVVPIRAEETAGELHARLTEVGAPLLAATLRDIDAVTPRPQEGAPTYAEKLTVDEFRLDLHRSAADLVRLVRAGNPRPGAWLEDAAGHRIKVWRAHEDDGRFVPDEVQPAGKRAMTYSAWRAGAHDPDPFA
jgi:methionyl-tRNA formyltransferase